ncbi:MAG TPA: prolyl aminopeptidase [Gammaproteobacteria bacterium]
MGKVESIFYPAIEPYRVHRLVADEYNLYLEESGNADGLPVLFLHGGPGAGSNPWQRRFFNPAGYRIVVFDQRGCGKSTPHAELNNNTTAHLIADIERIREHLQIDRWLVFGGSWGSTLALAYAEAHPEKVLGLILRGIFLCRPQDLHWFYQSGASALYPDAWQEFLQPLPLDRRHDTIEAYYELLTGKDQTARMAAAKAWATWEGRTATLLTDPNVVNHFADPVVALALSRIECHYFINQCFMRENQLLADAGRLADIPGVIVHGRYDVICPLEQAWELHQTWPNSSLQIIEQAGHAATEPGISRALVDAADRMLEKFT